MILDDIKKLQSCSITEITNDGELQMLFFRTYKALFGVICQTCQNSIRNAYQKLNMQGLKQYEIMTQIKNKTNIVAWTGLKYIRQANDHFHSEFLTDEKAIALLNKGFLQESDFKILPIEYKKTVIIPQEEIDCINEIKSLIKDGYTTDDILEHCKDVKKIGEKKANKKFILSLIEKANEI